MSNVPMTIRDPIIAIEPSRMHINPIGHHLYGQSSLSSPGYLYSPPLNPPAIPTFTVPNTQSDEAPPLSFTPSTSNDQSPPPSLSSSTFDIENIKPLSDPTFNEPEDGASVYTMKDFIASAIKFGPRLEDRTDVCDEIERHQPWFIRKSRPGCKICPVDPLHAKSHAINTISNILSCCPGFKRARITGRKVWVLSGERIELPIRPNKNAKQKEPAPAGGRKKGRPSGRKVLGERQFEDSKNVDIESEASSARNEKADTQNAAIAPAESQPVIAMSPPQPAHSNLPWSHLGGLYPIYPLTPPDPIPQLPSSLNTPWPWVPPYNLPYPPPVHFGNLDAVASVGHWSVDAAPPSAPDPNFLFL